MSKTSGVQDQVLTLPNGGGSVQDISSSFEADLNTGTGSFGLSIDLPSGPNGVVPKLNLRYHSGQGNGIWGIGWTLGSLTVARQTEGGLPTYAPGEDRFVIPGVDELVEMDNGLFRPRVDTLFYKISRFDAGWQIIDTVGTVHLLGTTAASRVSDDRGRTGEWLLDSTTNATGEVITYGYVADGPQRLLDTISWGTYDLKFIYEDRIDRLSNGRYRFLVETNKRCSRLELHRRDLNPSLLKSWNFDYVSAKGSQLSLLSRVTLRGHDENGDSIDAPPVTLSYSQPSTPLLQRVGSLWPGLQPPSFSDKTVELMDWDGDGLPDLLELHGRTARIWPNLGNGCWGVPANLNDFPGPSTLNDGRIALADLTGNGVVDILDTSGYLERFTPLKPMGGFDRTIELNRSPVISLNSTQSRLVDLNGDGITDLMQANQDSFSFVYRSPTGWDDSPSVIPRSESPNVDFADERTQLADMTGDGLQDIVRIAGGFITYWPALGFGNWADPIELANALTISRDFDAKRLFLVDVDGDGCADVVYVGAGEVTVWFNIGGRAISEPITISFLPYVGTDSFRFCDFMGNGTTGLLFSNVPDGPLQKSFLFLDFCGATKPYLLTTIENGMGLKTSVSYKPSTDFAIEARLAGHPWQTFHPFPVQCVATIEITDTVNGQHSLVSHRYHEARYDNVTRTYLGFQTVESVVAGDDSIPDQRSVHTFHLGLDPDNLSRSLTQDEQLTFGACRRRLLETEIFSDDGSPNQALPFSVVKHEYQVQLVKAANGNTIASCFEKQTTAETHERSGSPVFIKTITYDQHDEFGNILEQRQISGRPGSSPDQDITTRAIFAKNDARHIVSLPSRITQLDADNNPISVKIIAYDGDAFLGLPEGQVESGMTSRIEVLALTDELASEVYGVDLPDFESLGYHRRESDPGWWITTVGYERRDENPFVLATKSARGAVCLIEYDETKQFATTLVDPLGGTHTAIINERCCCLGSVTDQNNNNTTDSFDALWRVIKVVGPLDTDQFPSATYQYSTDHVPLQTSMDLRLGIGTEDSATQTQYYDGHGRTACTIVPGGALGPFISSGFRTYNSQGKVSHEFGPVIAEDATFKVPLEKPTRLFRYDGIGRQIEHVEDSGVRRQMVYGPDFTTITDDRIGAVGQRVTTQRHNSINQIVAVERFLDGRTLTSVYKYDAGGRLSSTVDPEGGTVSFRYDLLGRMISQLAMDTGLTTFVVDPSGNQIERKNAAGQTLRIDVDQLDRVVSISTGKPAGPDVRYTYLNPGDPIPADGANNRIGRLFKVEDDLGTLTHDYDAAGRTVKTSRFVKDLATAFETDFDLDGQGRILSITLPQISPDTDRVVLNYTYDSRGVPLSCEGFVNEASYDLNGRLSHWVFSNGVATDATFEDQSNRLATVHIAANDGTVLRDHHFSYDNFGNVLTINSDFSAESGQFSYDDLDRLITAQYANGDQYSYSYSDIGTPTNISGVGACTSAGNGSGQIVAAGVKKYQFDAAGRLQSSSAGVFTFDAADRLSNIEFSDGSAEQYGYDHNGARCFAQMFDGRKAFSITPSLDIIDGVPIIWVTFGSRRIASISESKIHFQHYDLLGTPTLITDANGQVSRRVVLGPYGSVRSDSMSPAPIEGTRLGISMIDQKSGLVCMGIRYYDPEIGRFISPDVVAATFAIDGWNFYSYARCNPLRYVDPSGASIWDVLAVIAVVLIVAALIVAAVFTGGASLPLLGVMVSVSHLLVATAIGVAGGAIIGGIAAYQAHGSIAEGVLFGGFVGGVSAFAGAYLSAGVFAAVSGAGAVVSTAVAGAVQGGIAGAGTGAAVGFGGGKGSVGDIFKHMLMGFATGAVTGALLGVFFGNFKPTDASGDGGQLRLFTTAKFQMPPTTVTGIDHWASTVQDGANWIFNGAGAAPNGITEFIFTDATGPQTLDTVFDVSNNGALITIPMGWAPTAYVQYGGAVLLNDASMVLDQTGAMPWDQQLMTLLNAAPLVGVALGYGLGDSTKAEHDALGWIRNNFSQQL